MSRDTSPSAFPWVFTIEANKAMKSPISGGTLVAGEIEHNVQSGMSLRDYFAAKAMGGMLACPIQPASGPEMYARDAYAIADAMLAERAK